MEAARKTKSFTKNEIVNWMIDFDGGKEMKVQLFKSDLFYI